MLLALVLLAFCTPLASAAREWAAHTWSEHVLSICTTILLYHAAYACAHSLVWCTATLTIVQAARHEGSKIPPITH